MTSSATTRRHRSSFAVSVGAASALGTADVTMAAKELATAFLVVVLIASQVSATSRLVATNAYWDHEVVNAKQGDRVTLTCKVVLGQLDGGESDVINVPEVYRIVHSHGARSLLLSDNGNMTSAFARLGRYDVTFSVQDVGGNRRRTSAVQKLAVITVTIDGVQGEDSGTFACQQLYNDDFIGYSDVTVYVDIDEVYITSISPTDILRIPTGSDVILVENPLAPATLNETGFGCTATISNGGIETLPPAMTVQLVMGRNGVNGSEFSDDGDVVDITSWFTSTEQTDATVTDSGLSVFGVSRNLTFVANRPDVELNGRILRCVASVTLADGVRAGRLKFEEKVVSSRIVVHYIPVLWCSETNHTVTLDSNYTITCTVKSNPSSNVTWSAIADPDETYDVGVDASVTFSSKAVSEDEIDVSLSITAIQQRHCRTYIIRAANVMGEKATSIRLLPRPIDVVTSATTALPFLTEELTSLSSLSSSSSSSSSPPPPSSSSSSSPQPVETTSVDDSQYQRGSEENDWNKPDDLVLNDRQQSMLNDEAVVVGENAPGHQLTSLSTLSVSSSDDVTVATVNSYTVSVSDHAAPARAAVPAVSRDLSMTSSATDTRSLGVLLSTFFQLLTIVGVHAINRICL